MESLSVVVPALNEEAGLALTLDEIMRNLGEVGLRDFEILVFNDGSTDRTAEIAEEYARKNPEIRAFHNEKPQGIGSSFKKGLELATKEYYVLIHGDYETNSDFLKELPPSLGEIDYVVPHVLDDKRPWVRRVISRTFTLLVNTLFGLKFKYYNGPNLFRTSALRKIILRTDGHAFMAETIVRLHQLGYRNYREIGFYARRRVGGKNKAFGPRNIWRVLKALWDLKTVSGHHPSPETVVKSQAAQPGPPPHSVHT